MNSSTGAANNNAPTATGAEEKLKSAGDIELTNLGAGAEDKKDNAPNTTTTTTTGEANSTSSKPAAETATTAGGVALWIYEFLKDWLATIVIGFLVVSYWRGSWLLLDLYSCGQPQESSLVRGDSFCFAIEPTNATRIKSAWVSYAVGNALLAVGVHLMWNGLWIPRKAAAGASPAKIVSFSKMVKRTCTVYVLGAATVNIWRGIWYLTDYLILPNDPVTSWWITSLSGIGGAFLMYSGPSLMAPPAMFNMDGPGINPPPMAVTILSSYYSITLPSSQKPPVSSTLVLIGDALLSFGVLPIFVVWFWRGTWLLMDNYLWGLTSEHQDVYMSLAYGSALGIGLLFLGSDDIVQLIPAHSAVMNHVAGRVRTLILAVGAVSFWRVVWLLWDEFIGGTSYWSAWVSHMIGWIGLLMLGCMACITAPPTTLGVDAFAHEDSADEPLFHDVPIPAESIFFFGIARRPYIVPSPSVEEEQSKVEVAGGGEVEDERPS